MFFCCLSRLQFDAAQVLAGANSQDNPKPKKGGKAPAAPKAKPPVAPVKPVTAQGLFNRERCAAAVAVLAELSW